jgi:hypothetical protein
MGKPTRRPPARAARHCRRFRRVRDDDEEDGPALTCGSSAEAAPFEVAAVVVA